MRTARDIMTRDPVIIRSSAKVSAAIQVLAAMEVRHLPVVNENNELVGMLSDRDLRGLSIPHLVDEEWLGQIQTALDANVATVMSSDVLSVQEESDLMEIIDLMLDYKVGAVPVVDADDNLVGIVSYMDLLRELSLFEANAAQ